jgi:hypothetical protein
VKLSEKVRESEIEIDYNFIWQNSSKHGVYSEIMIVIFYERLQEFILVKEV